MRITHLAIVIIDWSVVPLESLKLTDSFGSVSCHTKISLHRPLWVVWGRWTYFHIADFERQLSGIISGTKWIVTIGHELSLTTGRFMAMNMEEWSSSVHYIKSFRNKKSHIPEWLLSGCSRTYRQLRYLSKNFQINYTPTGQICGKYRGGIIPRFNRKTWHAKDRFYRKSH